MADRNVTANETFAEFRNTMNETMTDIGDITQQQQDLVSQWQSPWDKRR